MPASGTHIVKRQEAADKSKKENPIRHKEQNFHYEGGKTLEQLAQKRC